MLNLYLAAAVVSLVVYLLWPVVVQRLFSAAAFRLPPWLLRPLARNLRCPEGGVWGSLMNTLLASNNTGSVLVALDALNAQEGETVLEIGFGPGKALEALVPRVLGGAKGKGGLLLGVDMSESMVEAARALNEAAVASGRMRLHLGTAESLSRHVAASSVDRAFAVHCFYFWDEPLAGLAEVLRALRPGGTFYIVGLRKAEMSKTGLAASGSFTFYNEDEAERLMREAGFVEVASRTVQAGFPSKPPHMVVQGSRPPP